MMKYMILSILFSLPFINSRAEPRMADSFFRQGLYYDAITEYKRYQFFNPGTRTNHIGYRIALCYHRGGWYARAEKGFERLLENLEPNDLLSIKTQFRLIELYLLTDDLSLTAFELESLESLTLSFEQVNYKILLSAVADMKRKKWQTSIKRLNHIPVHSKYSTFAEKCRNYASRGALLPLKSPSKSLKLSTFLPGTGQIYSGRYFNGTVALLINGGLLYFMGRNTVHIFMKDSISERLHYALNLTLIYKFLFKRYYNGNKYNAYHFAMEHNRKVLEPLDSQVNSMLKNLNALSE